jgi:hypothetical protein
MSKGLTYNGAEPSPVLTTCCDAEWETDPEDRHSRSGVVFPWKEPRFMVLYKAVYSVCLKL